MIRTYIKYNWNLMWKRKSFLFVFWGLMAISVFLPFYYLFTNWGVCTHLLPSADSLYIGNGDSDIWIYISELYPFLIILPFGFSYMDEKKSGVDIYIQTRGEKKKYYYGQLITCFLGTAFVFGVPFMVNVILNGMMFPVTGNSHIATVYAYDYNWASAIVGNGAENSGWIFKSFAIAHPQWNNVLYVMIMVIASGIMGMVSYAISLFVRTNRIVVLIINYLFFRALYVLSRFFGPGDDERMNLNLIEYLCNGYFVSNRNYVIFWIALFIFAVISIVSLQLFLKKIEE